MIRFGVVGLVVACLFVTSFDVSAERRRGDAERAEGTVEVFADQEFAWIPAGKYYRGVRRSASSITSEFGGNDIFWEDEEPRQRVELTRGFWMQTKEVTHDQFKAFAEATDYETDAEKEGWSWAWDGAAQIMVKRPKMSWREPGWTPQGNEPVVCISWNDVAAYIAWLNTNNAGIFRLPTEAEWEYACQAGERKTFPWGNDAEDGQGHLNGADKAHFESFGNARPFPFDDGFEHVAPVGSFAANGWGLYDMLGNVAEWCSDWYSETYYDRKDSDEDPKGPETGSVRAVRGGGWLNYPMRCRPSNRHGSSPEFRTNALGFRLVREDTPNQPPTE